MTSWSSNKLYRVFRLPSDVEAAEPPSDVSIVSSETLEGRAERTCVELLDLTVWGEALENAEPGVPAARFGDGGAALAASTGAAGGLAGTSLYVASASAEDRCDAAPCCTTTE
ncbi:uncharacterized protein LOC144141892 [Haemaphysalis longicornis]